MPIGERPSSRLVLAGLIALSLAAAGWWALRSSRNPSSVPLDRNLTELTRQVAAIEEAERKVDATVWKEEILAQECGRVWEHLWDAINASTNKLAVLGQLAADQIVPPQLGEPESLPYGIGIHAQVGLGPAWTLAGWKSFLAGKAARGWQLSQIEFRHVGFEVDAQGRPARSRLAAAAHLDNPRERRRAILQGELLVDWAGRTSQAHRVETKGLTVRTRVGEPPFEEILAETVIPPAGSYFIDPVILYDLDGDGVSEIILAARNVVYHWTSTGKFEWTPLCRYPPGLIFTGILGDFDGDRAVDFLCAKFTGLALFKGSSRGTFDEPEQLVWSARPHLKYAQALTCGDVDGDGDLDIWLGQYKVPYDRGQMPTPYYDANDGHPSYLLLNDGQGHFTDATAPAGLGQKRWRRAYSASFVDLNGDGSLDLAVANDFAGLDLYLNDGRGKFTDRTRELIAEPHSFGMSQVFSDFDQDGRLDLLLIGMNVPVADRLSGYGKSRPGFENYLAMAGPMAFGNRLLLGRADGTFAQTGMNAAVARSGWSWGGSPFDFDNDSYPDLYIANGHETKESVRDYETEFWLHDIYVGNAKDNLAAFAYFQAKGARTRGKGMSYGGYEKNRLFWSQHGQSFVEVAHLFGVALEQDSRNVVADDFDQDGSMDLVVTTFEVWPQPKQTLRVFKNNLHAPAHWIGFRLREQGQGLSPAGATVSIRYANRTCVQPIVAGDSYRSQGPATAHFGLGPVEKVEQAEVRWPNGRIVTVKEPKIDQYHTVILPHEAAHLPDKTVPPGHRNAAQ